MAASVGSVGSVGLPATMAATPTEVTAAGGIPAHWEDLASFVRFLEQRGSCAASRARSMPTWRSAPSRSR